MAQLKRPPPRTSSPRLRPVSYAPTHSYAIHDDVVASGDDGTMDDPTMHDHRTACPDATGTNDAASADYCIGVGRFDGHGYSDGGDGKHGKQE
jgi:hypothetical protein